MDRSKIYEIHITCSHDTCSLLIILVLIWIFILLCLSKKKQSPSFLNLKGTQIPNIPIRNTLTTHVASINGHNTTKTPKINIKCIHNVVEKINAILSESYDNKNYFVCNTLSYYYSVEGDIYNSFGCGYKNMQTLSSALLKFNQGKNVYTQFLFNGKNYIPDVRKLQKHIDKAHISGFDFMALSEIGIIHGTRSWIGTSDVTAVLRYFAIPAAIYSFNLEKSEFRNEFFLWVQNYFQTRYQRKEPFVPPIYCQQHGHSWTIIGICYDDSKDDWIMLILNPSINDKEAYLIKNMCTLSDLKILMKSKNEFVNMKLFPYRKRDLIYELVAIPAYGIMDNKDRNNCKMLQKLDVTCKSL